MEVHVNNYARYTEVTQFIANELLKILARRDDSHMQKHLAKCPAYKNGLTNGESLAATMGALSMVQLEVAAEIIRLTETVDTASLGDDESPEPVKYTPEPTWRRITKEWYDAKRSENFPTSTRETTAEMAAKGAYDERAFLEAFPIIHDKDGRPLYAAFLSRTYNGTTNYFECDALLSVFEFQKMIITPIAHPRTDGAVPVPAGP